MNFWQEQANKLSGHQPGYGHLWDSAGVDPQSGSGLDQFGFPLSGRLPDGAIAAQTQLFADRQAYRWNDARARDAQMILQQGLDTLGSYRPGGVAQLTSPYYSQMAQTELQRRIVAPDLMYWDRRDAELRARKAAEKASWLSFGSQLLGTAVGAVAGGPTTAPSTMSGDQPPGTDVNTTQYDSPTQPPNTSWSGPESGPAGYGGGEEQFRASSATSGGKDSQQFGGPTAEGGREDPQGMHPAGGPGAPGGPADPGGSPTAPPPPRDPGFTAMAGQEFIPTGTAHELAAPLGMTGDDLVDAALISEPDLGGAEWNDWMMGWLDYFTVHGTNPRGAV